MTSPLTLPPEIAAFAAAEMARLEVPGLAIGVLHEGEVYAEGFGVTSVDHPLPVRADTLFQIGSTSKTFTATAVMQLVEEGCWTWRRRCDAIYQDSPCSPKMMPGG